MKTRELLTCDTKALESKARGLKPKELRRHIDRIAAQLGVSDTNGLLGQILETIMGVAEPPGHESGWEPPDEARAIFLALEGQMDVTDANKDVVLRLIVLALAYLRLYMERQIKETRRARHAGQSHGHHHHEGRPCGDPLCPGHGDQTARG